MVDEMKKAAVHQGRNVGAGRYWKNITQETLAKELGMSQSQISDLEKEAKIDTVILDKIAKCMNVNLDYLETYVPEEDIKTYHMSDFDNDLNNTISDQATETENIGGGNITNNNQKFENGISFEEVKELYKELRKQDKEKAEMRILLAKNNIEYNPSDN